MDTCKSNSSNSRGCARACDRVRMQTHARRKSPAPGSDPLTRRAVLCSVKLVHSSRIAYATEAEADRSSALVEVRQHCDRLRSSVRHRRVRGVRFSPGCGQPSTNSDVRSQPFAGETRQYSGRDARCDSGSIAVDRSRARAMRFSSCDRCSRAATRTRVDRSRRLDWARSLREK